MSRLVTASLLRILAVSVLSGACVIGTLPRATGAAGSKQLQRIRGTIGYQTAAASTDFKPVFGKFDLPDADFAVTLARSAALVAMPDSSLIALGENTAVQVSAFDSAAAAPGSAITINGGTMRFDIKRPQGGAANYRFLTPTSQTAVRGTIGLISFINGVTTVGCVVCAADSVSVTAAGQTVTLVSGQFVTVSAAGAIATGTLSSVVGAFSSAGVSVSAQAGAVAAGLPAGGIAGLGAAASTAVVAGAAVAGTAVGVAASSQTTQQPAQTSMPTMVPTSTPTITPTATPTIAPITAPTSTPSPVPTPTPTPTQAGNVNVTGHPKPVATAGARAPLTAPPLVIPGPAGRFGR